LIVAGVILSGCAWTVREQSVTAASGQKLQEALNRQTAANQDLDDRLAKAQLLLLEKEIQTEELGKKLEEAILEVVRTKAKLRSFESKAEAASALAEGEIALKTLQADGAGTGRDAVLLQAQELLRAGNLELKRENFGGALYLATRAKVIMKEGEARSKDREKIPTLPGEASFVMPLPLRLVSPGELRQHPRHDSKVLFSLPKGSTLVGFSYKGLWVRVRTEGGQGGWIHYNLIRKR
jgi:hypothetical protein